MYHLECIKKASGFHGSSRLNVVLVLLKVCYLTPGPKIYFLPRTKIVSHGQTNVFCVI